MNEAKSKVQTEVLEILKKQESGIVAIATGVGKTKIGIDYIKYLYSTNSAPPIYVWVVPTEKLRDEGVRDEFYKWDAKGEYACVIKTCYASLNKIKNLDVDLVILDEGHRITDNNAKFFDQNKVKRTLVLTATPPHEEEKRELLFDKLNLDIIYELPLPEAEKLGLVAPYRIKIVETYLDDVEKYVKAGNKNKPFLTTEKKQYEFLTRRIQKLMYSGDREVPQYLFLQRARFIYTLKSKNIAALKLLESLPEDERILIFHKSIEESKKLCKYTFNSTTDDTYYNQFVEGKINRLSVVDSVNEGHNIPNLDKAIIVQLNSSPRELVQRKLCA